MSHEKAGTAYDPGARGHELQGRSVGKHPVLGQGYGGQQAAPHRYIGACNNCVRKDWSPEYLIENLEDRARGYSGVFRQLICTAAAMLKDAISEDLLKAAAEEAAPVVSKRNQQPGRLSGGEREALKHLVARARQLNQDGDGAEVMAMGRALLTKVRKRALGGDPMPETVDCSALMPVGVEDDGS